MIPCVLYDADVSFAGKPKRKLIGPPPGFNPTGVDPDPVPPSATSKRFSIPPSRPPPPPPEEPEDEVEEGEEEAEESKDEEETSPTPKGAKSVETPAAGEDERNSATPGVKTIPASPPPPTPAKSAKRYSIPLPPRPPPPPPVEVDEEIAEEVEEHATEEGEEGGQDTSTKPSRPQRPIPELPPATPVDGLAQAGFVGEDEDEMEEPADDSAVLGGIVVQEPEEMDDELAGIADEHGQVHLRLDGQGVEYDSAEDTSDDERYENYKSALSRNGCTFQFFSSFRIIDYSV